MTEIMDEIKKTVMAGGDEVAQGTTEYDIYRLDHSNCDGCKYNLGCAKTVRVALLILLPISYKPKDFNDFAVMMDKMTKLNRRVMEAKSMEELDTIEIT